jgi:hypothetical protein
VKPYDPMSLQVVQSQTARACQAIADAARLIRAEYDRLDRETGRAQDTVEGRDLMMVYRKLLEATELTDSAYHLAHVILLLREAALKDTSNER